MIMLSLQSIAAKYKSKHDERNSTTRKKNQTRRL